MSTEESELHKSKRQLLELLEHKDLEISEKNATIKSYLDKIVSCNFAICFGFLFYLVIGCYVLHLFFSSTLCDCLSNEKMHIPKRSRREKKKKRKEKRSLV